MELYVICIEFECDNGIEFEIKPKAYKTKKDAEQALAEIVEKEKLESWIKNYDDDDLILEESTDSFYCTVVDDDYYTKIDITKIKID